MNKKTIRKKNSFQNNQIYIEDFCGEYGEYAPKSKTFPCLFLSHNRCLFTYIQRL